MLVNDGYHVAVFKLILYKFKNENHNEEHYEVRLKTNRLSISSDFFS